MESATFRACKGLAAYRTATSGKLSMQILDGSKG
jgi:hypothetical protein